MTYARRRPHAAELEAHGRQRRSSSRARQARRAADRRHDDRERHVARRGNGRQPDRAGEGPGRSAGGRRCARQEDPLRLASRHRRGRAGACRMPSSKAASTTSRAGRRPPSRRRSSGTPPPRRLIVDTKPGLGPVERADFRGNAHFVDGELTADAPRALYNIERDQLDLSPSDGDTGKGPILNNHAAHRAGAQHPPVAVDAEAQGRHGRSEHHQAAEAGRRGRSGTGGRGAPAAGARARRAMPVMLKQDRPVNVYSNRLEYDGVVRSHLQRQRAPVAGQVAESLAKRSCINDRTGKPDRAREGSNDDAARGRRPENQGPEADGNESERRYAGLRRRQAAGDLHGDGRDACQPEERAGRHERQPHRSVSEGKRQRARTRRGRRQRDREAGDALRDRQAPRLHGGDRHLRAHGRSGRLGEEGRAGRVQGIARQHDDLPAGDRQHPRRGDRPESRPKPSRCRRAPPNSVTEWPRCGPAT